MDIKVLGARLLVKENKQEEKTASGIIVPGRDKEPTFIGEVLAVGNGAILENGSRVPMDINVGDTVVYTTFSGSPLVYQNEQYIILNERDVLCVLPSKDN